MAEKRLACWQCRRYDRTARHCRDGKTNPKRKAETIEVAGLLGVHTLCCHNPWRDALALRMYFPHHPDTLTASRPKRTARRASIEIEIEPPPEGGGE